VLTFSIIGTFVPKSTIKDNTMVDKNFKQEACQLYIEQEIEDRLAQGKTPGNIGKELTKEVNQIFEASVKPATIKKRAQRIRSTPSKKSGQNRDKIVITDRDIIGTIRDISDRTGMPVNSILALGLESYKATYLQ